MPPLVWHSAPTSLTELVESMVMFQVFDLSGISRVVLHYRDSSSSEYSETVMRVMTGDDYVAALPAVAVRLPHVEYYVERSTGSGTAPWILGADRNLPTR